MDQSNENDQAKIRTNRTFICSVVFIDIVEYSTKPVIEQISLKERFNGILADSLKDIPVNDRIILDTGDGAAIGFLSDPEDALFVAMSIRDVLNGEQGKPDLCVRMGINLGPVKILKDINKQMNLIGDGINVAQRIMSFAEPGQLLVSRSYYDIVSCLSQEYAKLFQYKGAKADKHIREHDIYSVENDGLSHVSSIHHHSSQETSELLSAKKPVSEEEKRKEEIGKEKTFNPAATGGNDAFPSKNKLIVGICMAAFIVILTVGFLIIKSQENTTESNTFVKLPAKQAEDKNEKVKIEEDKGQTKGMFRSGSKKADGIEFVLEDVKKSDQNIAFIVHIHNSAKMTKSVAIYDDYVRWPKSVLIDQKGSRHEVNTVVFSKGGKTITSQASGTQGLSISPGQMVTVSLTFKNVGKTYKKFVLHPFVYTGRSWTEHDLLMKSEI